MQITVQRLGVVPSIPFWGVGWAELLSWPHNNVIPHSACFYFGVWYTRLTGQLISARWTVPAFSGVDSMTTDNIITTMPVETDDQRISREARERMEALTASRDACVSGIKKGDGLIATYARNISAVCGEGWVWLVGKESATVKAERKLFDRAMGVPDEVLTEADKKLKAKCNEYWIRIKKEAGYVPGGKVGAVDTIDAKNLKELKTMINRILNEESEADSCPLSSEAKADLITAFETLGGDATTLGTKA